MDEIENKVLKAILLIVSVLFGMLIGTLLAVVFIRSLGI